jgi:hypothetical protein
VTRIWTLAVVVITGGLTVALFGLPLAGLWWPVIRGIYYLPILMVSVRHGPLAGLTAGLGASLLYAFAADSKGMSEMAWLSILIPDFALVGLMGGKFLKSGTRLGRVSLAGGSEAWPRLGRTSQIENNFDLNSIASIQSAAGLLSDEDTPPEQREELAGIISTECQHLSASIQGLLQLSHAPAQPQFFVADFGPVIDGAIHEVEFVLGGRGALVHKEIASDLPSVECDPEQIRNLLLTLIINSLQSLPPGTSVILAARCADEGVLVDIMEQNRESFLRRLLNRFSSAYPRATSVALAAAYQIVQHHGGRIRSNRNVRKGLEFTVWLPLRRKCTHGGGQNTVGGGR